MAEITIAVIGGKEIKVPDGPYCSDLWENSCVYFYDMDSFHECQLFRVYGREDVKHRKLKACRRAVKFARQKEILEQVRLRNKKNRR